jgi:DNA invertase Pin-like site-specific DNA recombinase
MKKVLALLRCSTREQDLDRQKTDVERLRHTHGLTIEQEIPLPDVSGRTVLEHPDMQKALRELKRPDIHGFAVAALDRLFRVDHFEDFKILDHFRNTGKVIISGKEGVVDPSTDIGFQICLMSGAMGGMEWRTFRQRTLDGKREKRKLARNVTGSESLPYGLLYRRVTNASGKTVDGIWSYDEPKVAKIREAYRILLTDPSVSLSALARRVGWSGGHSLRRSLENPIWRGVRRSAPMAGETEPLEIRLPLEPLLTDAQWSRAQVLLQKRCTWSKETRVQRFLGTGLLVCECGRKFYTNPNRKGFDNYFCSSKHPSGPGCGAARLHRRVVDEAIVRIAEEYMTDPKFLSGVFRRIDQVPATGTAENRAKELAKLAARRQKWIEQYDADRISKTEFEQKMDAVEKAKREVEAEMPSAPPPALDHRAVIAGLVRALARFRTWPFAEQHAMLKRVVRGFRVLDSAITEFTFSGAFLGELSVTKTAQPSW